MSRSYRKHPFCPITTSDSDHEDKKHCSRQLRRAVRQKLHVWRGEDNMILPLNRETVNVWSFAKDGKRRFNPKAQPRLMRK